MAPKLGTQCMTTLAAFAALSALALAVPVAGAYGEEPGAGAGEDALSSAETFRGYPDDGRSGERYPDWWDRQEDGRQQVLQEADGRQEDAGFSEAQSRRAAAVPTPVPVQPSASEKPAPGGPAPAKPAPRKTAPHKPSNAPEVREPAQSPRPGKGIRPGTGWKPGQHPGRETGARPQRPAKVTPSPVLPSPSLAGRLAGEGLERPGRTAPPFPAVTTPPALPQDLDPERARESDLLRQRELERDRARASARAREKAEEELRERHREREREASASPAVEPANEGKAAPPAASGPMERQIPVMTLGAGCALMGLGLGYMGLRLRRR
ncbi:hypothetical protein [Streptomyces formicae]|uniref:Translation initiation factor 2 n=1 Tax=Streptomyces formicae TaxID=1616117 RepID=A0ABY3WEW0_9ACTN|nr:hypothetical protein [Streptomyces formicae]UNM10181.1 hypothetical protein J4032_00465 [Streptomyces formicae]